MTDQEWEDLGRRAVSCKGWRWLPGMLARTTPCDGYPARVVDDEFAVYDADGEWLDCGIEGVPDFRDLCTLGGLLALVREGKATFAALVLPTYPNEAAALVAALEAAP